MWKLKIQHHIYSLVLYSLHGIHVLYSTTEARSAGATVKCAVYFALWSDNMSIFSIPLLFSKAFW